MRTIMPMGPKGLPWDSPSARKTEAVIASMDQEGETCSVWGEHERRAEGRERARFNRLPGAAREGRVERQIVQANQPDSQDFSHAGCPVVRRSLQGDFRGPSLRAGGTG